MNINSLLKLAVEKKASDILILAGVPPVLRVGRELISAGSETLPPPKAKEIIYSMLRPEQIKQFEKEKELDCAFELSGVGRFRANVHWERGNVAAALRAIPTKIPTFESLHLPLQAADFANEPRGLILVTGPTGSGKSTTLASLIDIINTSRRCHVITIEDPIEYLHQNKRSVIEQRELGIDTYSFAGALKHSLRQDPDVILVGEMRDLDTISTAITAAETGHLVFSTLHTNDSVQAVDRMIDVFPPHQQQQIRLQLSLTLKGIIAQQLLPTVNGQGLVPAVEILKVTPAVANIIRKASTQEIYSMIEIGSKFGMRPMNTSLKELVKKGLISRDIAVATAANPEHFLQFLAK